MNHTEEGAPGATLVVGARESRRPGRRDAPWDVYHSDQPFTDLAEACDFWEEYLGVSGPEVRGHLERFLAERLTHEASGWLAPYAKEALVIWWPVAGLGPERPVRSE